MSDPTLAEEELARLLSEADVHVNKGDYPSWDDLSTMPGLGQDEYRKAARYVLRRCRVARWTSAEQAGKDTSGGQPPAGESTQPQPEPFVPRTERSFWVAIADALNDAAAAGMAVGIEIDGALTDYRAWSVVWNRATERWEVGGYEDEDLDDVLGGVPSAPDFFQPGHTYTDPDSSYDWAFRCDRVTTHPEDGERTALGWRHFQGKWAPCAYGEDDWDISRYVGHHDTSEDGGR